MRRTGTSESGGRDLPQIELIRGYQTSSIQRWVTRKSSPSAGSAVAAEPRHDPVVGAAPDEQSGRPAGEPDRAGGGLERSRPGGDGDDLVPPVPERGERPGLALGLRALVRSRAESTGDLVEQLLGRPRRVRPGRHDVDHRLQRGRGAPDRHLLGDEVAAVIEVHLERAGAGRRDERARRARRGRRARLGRRCCGRCGARFRGHRGRPVRRGNRRPTGARRRLADCAAGRCGRAPGGAGLGRSATVEQERAGDGKREQPDQGDDGKWPAAVHQPAHPGTGARTGQGARCRRAPGQVASVSRRGRASATPGTAGAPRGRIRRQ